MSCLFVILCVHVSKHFARIFTLFILYILGNFIEMLNRAHKFSFEDQRGPIDSKHLQIPDFLLSNSLIKSQSLNHNINTHALSSRTEAMTSHDTNKKYENKYKKPSLAAIFNESTSSLPVMAATSPQTSSALTRSRSPILIIYDNEEEGEHLELNPHLNEPINNNNNNINNKAFRNSINIDESCCIENSIGIDRSLLSLNEEADEIPNNSSIKLATLNCASTNLNKSLQKSTSDTQIRPDSNESHKSSQLIMKTNSKNQISYV